MALVQIDNVAMRYGGATSTMAVSELTMQVERGEFAVVVGPSSCGKSTLMKLVTGLHIPQTGVVTVASQHVTKPVSIVGMAFQNPTMLPWRTTLENILLPLQTLYTTTLGFLIAVAAGLGLGLFIGWSRSIYAGLYPIMIGFNAIPKVALVPILVIWFGIGTVPAVLTAFLISFFPIVVNVATIEPETEDVLRALGAKKLDIMLKVGIPRSMPYFFGSLKVAITLAFVGSVVSESVASNNGLGQMMSSAQSQFNVPLVFAGLIMLAIEGIVMYALMAWLEKRMTGWAHHSTMSNAI